MICGNCGKRIDRNNRPYGFCDADCEEEYMEEDD